MKLKEVSQQEYQLEEFEEYDLQRYQEINKIKEVEGRRKTEFDQLSASIKVLVYGYSWCVSLCTRFTSTRLTFCSALSCLVGLCSPQAMPVVRGSGVHAEECTRGDPCLLSPRFGRAARLWAHPLLLLFCAVCEFPPVRERHGQCIGMRI